MTANALGRGLAEFEHRQAIADLLSDYCYALDRGIEPMFRSLWLPDAAWQFDPPLGRYEGLTRIMAAWHEIRAQTSDVHHLTADVRILHLDAASATVRSDGIAQANRDGHNSMMFVHFNDELCLHDGEWRFAERFVHFFAPAVVDVTGGLG